MHSRGEFQQGENLLRAREWQRLVSFIFFCPITVLGPWEMFNVGLLTERMKRLLADSCSWVFLTFDVNSEHEIECRALPSVEWTDTAYK